MTASRCVRTSTSDMCGSPLGLLLGLALCATPVPGVLAEESRATPPLPGDGQVGEGGEQPRHNKSGPVLTVNLRSGRTVKFRDIVARNPFGEEDAVETYEYDSYIPRIAQHLVRVSFYEGEGFRIVDDRSGVTAKVAGPPVVSPTARWFACADADVSYGDPGIEVWATGPKAPKKVFHAKKVARPENISWAGDNVFRVELHDDSGTLIGFETYSWDGKKWSLRSKCGSEYIYAPPDSTSRDQLPSKAPDTERALPPGCDAEGR